MSIHLESGNLSYDNFSTQKSFYGFLLNQQDKTKLIINKKYCITKLLKIIYAIFYKVLIMKKLISSICSPTKTQNIYFTSFHQPNKSIRQTKKVNDKLSIEKIQNINWQCFFIQIIKQVDKPKNEVVLDERSLYIFENILSNYRIQ